MLKAGILLFFEFFKIGLFTYGGGWASLPFLYRLIDSYNWFSNFELTQMIAISSLTPGPVGFNMSTFAGFKTLGISGAIVAGIGLVLPMLVITTQVFRLYRKFYQNVYVKSVMYVLRPTSCALISYVFLKLIYSDILRSSFSFALLDYKAFVILIILFLSTLKLKRNPINYMILSVVLSFVFKYFKL